MESRTNLKRIAGEKNLLAKEIPKSKIITEGTNQKGNIFWNLQIEGPEDCPFEGFLWTLEIEFQNYPFQFPNIKMLTPIFHPDIDSETGEFCQQMLDSDKWVPARKLHDVIKLILTILKNPSGENQLNKDATQAFKKDVKAFNKLAKEHAAKNGVKK